MLRNTIASLITSCYLILSLSSGGVQAKSQNSCQQVTVHALLDKNALYPADFYVLPDSTFFAVFAQKSEPVSVTDVVRFTRDGAVLKHFKTGDIRTAAIRSHENQVYTQGYPDWIYPLRNGGYIHLASVHSKEKQEVWAFGESQGQQHIYSAMRSFIGPDLAVYSSSLKDERSRLVFREAPLGYSLLNETVYFRDGQVIVQTQQGNSGATTPFYIGYKQKMAVPYNVVRVGINDYLVWGWGGFKDRDSAWMVKVRGKYPDQQLIWEKRVDSKANSTLWNVLRSESSKGLNTPSGDVIIFTSSQNKKDVVLDMVWVSAEGSPQFSHQVKLRAELLRRRNSWRSQIHPALTGPSVTVLGSNDVVTLSGKKMTLLKGRSGEKLSERKLFGHHRRYVNPILSSQQDVFPKQPYVVAVNKKEHKPVLVSCSI